MSFRLAPFVLTAALLFCFACDPPGKPKADDAENLSRENITDFATLYSMNCSGCHGNDGVNGAARTLNQPLYLALLGQDNLRHIIRYGRPGTSMPAWAMSQGGSLTDKQIDILVNGIFKNWSRPQQFQNAQLLPYHSDTPGDASAGKRLFLMNCFMCHGKGAPIGPVNQPSYLSLVSNEYLRSAILAGRPDLGMPDYRHLKLGKALSDKEVSDLVAYLASLRPPDAAQMMQNASAAAEQQPQAVANETANPPLNSAAPPSVTSTQADQKPKAEKKQK